MIHIDILLNIPVWVGDVGGNKKLEGQTMLVQKLKECPLIATLIP